MSALACTLASLLLAGSQSRLDVTSVNFSETFTRRVTMTQASPSSAITTPDGGSFSGLVTLEVVVSGFFVEMSRGTTFRLSLGELTLQHDLGDDPSYGKPDWNSVTFHKFTKVSESVRLTKSSVSLRWTQNSLTIRYKGQIPATPSPAARLILDKVEDGEFSGEATLTGSFGRQTFRQVCQFSGAKQSMVTPLGSVQQQTSVVTLTAGTQGGGFGGRGGGSS